MKYFLVNLLIFSLFFATLVLTDDVSVCGGFIEFPRDINPALKKLVGVLFALVCGLLIALSYIPILYIENNYPNASQDQNDYALSYNTGLFLGSLVLFIIYCLVNKNQPKVYPEAILPTFIAGIMWMVSKFKDVN